MATGIMTHDYEALPRILTSPTELCNSHVTPRNSVYERKTYPQRSRPAHLQKSSTPNEKIVNHTLTPPPRYDIWEPKFFVRIDLSRRVWTILRSTDNPNLTSNGTRPNPDIARIPLRPMDHGGWTEEGSEVGAPEYLHLNRWSFLELRVI